MIKKLLFIFVFTFSSLSFSQEAIQQWVYNMLERAQLNIDNGNLEQAEKTYKDYSDRSVSYTHLTLPTKA